MLAGIDEPSTRHIEFAPGAWFMAVLACFWIAIVLFVFPFRTVPVAGWLAFGVTLAYAQLSLMWLLLGSSGVLRGFGGVPLLLLLLMIPELICPLVFFVIPLVIVGLEDMKLHRFPKDRLPSSKPLQFSTRQLMGAVSVAAMLFGFGQISLASETVDAANPNAVRIAFALIGKAVVMIACAVFVMALPLTAVWTVLSPGRVLPRFVTISVVWLLGTALIVHFSQAMLSDWAGTVVVMAMGMICLLGALAVVRRDGYRYVEGSVVRRLVIEGKSGSTN
jgi:hypothetical protein